MADSALTGGSGAGGPVRVLTGLGAGSADQQVITLADSNGNLLGTNGAPIPVTISASGGQTIVSGSITATTTNTPGTAVTASTSAQVVASVVLAGNVTFHLVTSAFVGTLIFEASVDGGLNYGSLFAIREDGTGSESSTAINTASAFIRMYTSALPGFQYFRVRCSAFTSGSIAIVIAPGPTLIEPTPSLSTSTASIGSVGLNAGSNTIGTVNMVTPTAFALNSAATTNATAVKASAGTMYGLSVSNSGAAAAFLKLYNQTTAPTVGTSVPVLTIPISASGVVSPIFGQLGHRFTTGIALAITNLVADTDTTAVAAAQVKVLIDYV